MAFLWLWASGDCPVIVFIHMSNCESSGAVWWEDGENGNFPVGKVSNLGPSLEEWKEVGKEDWRRVTHLAGHHRVHSHVGFHRPCLFFDPCGLGEKCFNF